MNSTFQLAGGGAGGGKGGGAGKSPEAKWLTALKGIKAAGAFKEAGERPAAENKKSWVDPAASK